MEIKKGTIIRIVKTNEKIKEANKSYKMEVVRVNKKTYTMRGITYSWGCKLMKEALMKTHKDEYGTITKYEVVAQNEPPTLGGFISKYFLKKILKKVLTQYNKCSIV